MHPDEIKTVAQAITDAHANKPGNDYMGRIDDAKTVIAAFDAIMKFRATKIKAKSEPKEPEAAAPAPAPVEPAPAPVVAEPSPAPAPELDNVTPIKPTAAARAKGKKA